MKKFIFLAVLLLFAAPVAFCVPTTETITPTETVTITETATPADTSTITPTATITATFTVTPVAQDKILAYPNPVPKGAKEMGISYPIANIAKVQIIIYAVDGSKVGEITDKTPNGYTHFNIERLSRGIYLYQVIIEYSDGSKKKEPLGKFAIVK